MSAVPLDRRFIVWTDEEAGDPELMGRFGANNVGLGWEDLLAKHRVVILAEAGSGKTTELQEQARLAAARGSYAFFATLREVGRQGLPSALRRAEALKLEEWRGSDQPAWFFFDSVDEAKKSDVRFDEALKKIADGIEGGESRAHIVLSGRHTDWELRRDLHRLEEWLGMLPPDLEVSAPDPNELLIRVVRREEPPKKASPRDAPHILVMSPLDPARVETFARCSGVANTKDFLDRLDKANLWDLARRPLDLQWLVDFWISQGAFGSLAEMLELSLRKRLLEPDPDRARKDPLEQERALNALERIGAGLVLQGLRDIAIPDGGLDFKGGPSALDLAEILPDWSGEDRARLMSRAVFDPASAGMARLHNDNKGAVRSFLAARWLKRLMDAGCSKIVVIDLLFADTYGLPLVIPSMRQTAAWLSLWNPDAAREVIEREPLLMMDAGDPASLSLSVRERALTAVVQRAVAHDEYDMPDRESLKRFASSDMAPRVRSLWGEHSGSAAARELLLSMIWLGELECCADIAVAASFGKFPDRYTQMFSGRALMAVATRVEKRRYAEYIRDHSACSPIVLVWDAVDELFPTDLYAEDLLSIIGTVDLNDHSGGLSLDYLGPELAGRLDSSSEAEKLLAGLIGRLDARLDATGGSAQFEDEPTLSTVVSVARRLLDLSPETHAPYLSVDAALLLGDAEHYGWQGVGQETPDLLSRLHATPERRRMALWRASERLVGAKRMHGKPITDFRSVEMLGYSPGLRPEDCEWLLNDAEHRTAPNERLIAATGVLSLCHGVGDRSEDLARIKAIGMVRPEVGALIEEWMRPPATIEGKREIAGAMQRSRERKAMETADREQAWRVFADRLRADPDQLRAIGPPTEDGVDSRLYHLWELLRAAGKNQSRYAISDLSALVPIFGSEVVAAFHDALVAYWRRWAPQLRSERPAEKRNSIRMMDCVGITGVTLEAAANPDWAVALSHDEAVRAAIYATLELNGFPPWLADLARAHPDAIRETLLRAMEPELSTSDAWARCDELEKVSRADPAICSVVADYLFAHLQRNEALALVALRPILGILRAGCSDACQLTSFLAARFQNSSKVDEESVYYEPLYKLDPIRAIDALDAKLSRLSLDRRKAVGQAVFSMLFGWRWGDKSMNLNDLPLQSLERLVLIAYGAIRLEDDNERPTGVYTPDIRDDAESARSVLLGTLANTPGRAAFDAINRLMKNPDFPVSRKRMMEIALERAGLDSEREPWTSAEVCRFESDFQLAPRNAFDLQRLALRKIADMQHNLFHDDYAEGEVVARLPKEVDVQKWVASRLRIEQGRSYSIEREPHVADEKEPDIRFRAKASDASVAMEIKVAESWTLAQLEAALRLQLIGRYLRHSNNRYGILLLVHRRPRKKGWRTADGDWLSFNQVVEHLAHLHSPSQGKPRTRHKPR